MPKTRNETVENVRSAFMPAERSVEAAAAQGARCIAVMIEERAKSRLPFDVGRDALDHIVKATTLALESRRHFLDAHQLLACIPAEIGATVSYGADDCPPNEPFTSAEEKAPLRIVA